jgi:hypothetical protein
LSINNQNNNPEYNPFYHWGLICFTTGLLLVTIVPFMAHRQFIFPPAAFFMIPGGLFMITSLILWLFSRDTELYQAMIIGAGLVYYGVFQILLNIYKSTSSQLYVFEFIIIIGLMLFISAYNPLRLKRRDNFNPVLLYFSIFFSITMIVIILLEVFFIV